MLATSTDVERAFSRGGLTISKLQHSLSDNSARAATILGFWSKLEGVILKEVIIDSFKNKSRRPKKKHKTTKTMEPESDGSIVINSGSLLWNIYQLFYFLMWVPVGIPVSTHEDPPLQIPVSTR